MFNEIKKELTSFKLLTLLGIVAVSIYLFQFVISFLRDFSDIIWILILGWLVSFIMEPFADFFSDRFKIPKSISTVIVFVLAGVLIALIFLLLIPDIISQFKTIDKSIPGLMQNAPPQLQKGVDKFIDNVNASSDLIPSITQFLVNLVSIFILSFYLVVDKDNINRKFYALTPRKYHEMLHFIQSVIDSSFASFVRIQLLWGVLGGLITWIVLTIFGVHFAASTSLLAGILTAIPMIGPIIGVLPPLLLAIVDKPDMAIWIFLAIFIPQQFIFNVLGPKLIGKAFKLNPIMVIFALLIGIKIAGFMGAILAVPVISIIMIVGQELYDHYFKSRED